MKLEEKISDRRVVYLLKKEQGIAFELSLLYFILAKRKKAKKKIADACSKAICWLKKAEVEIADHLKAFSPDGQLERIEKLLVANKAKVGARRYLRDYIPELCRQFGLV